MSLEEQAIEILDESASDADSNLVDKLVEEFPTLAGSLVKTINKRNNTSLEIPKKQRISKNKILLDITSTLSKINGELIIVNSRIQAQNDLLRANLGFTANSIGNLEYNDSLLTGKLDSVLQALQLQNEFMREKEEDQERDSIEKGGEGTDPGAFSEGYSKGYKKGSPIKELLLEKVRNYLTTRILKFFTKKGMLNILTSVKSKLGWKTAAKGWDHIALNPKQNRFMKPRWWQAIDDYMKPITKPLTSKGLFRNIMKVAGQSNNPLVNVSGDIVGAIMDGVAYAQNPNDADALADLTLSGSQALLSLGAIGLAAVPIPGARPGAYMLMKAGDKVAMVERMWNMGREGRQMATGKLPVGVNKAKALINKQDSQNKLLGKFKLSNTNF